MLVVTVYPRFVSKGGAQDVALTVAKGLSPTQTPVVLYDNPEICNDYLKEPVIWERMSFRSILKYHRQGAIFLSHHRKVTTFLRLVSIFCFLNKLRIVHVAHNTFSTLRNVTLLPDNVVAVSKTVKSNLIEYFKVQEKNIKVIYNGMIDKFDESFKSEIETNSYIKILFLGRIDPVKRQISFYQNTKGKLNKNIKIYFAGIGDDYEQLKTLLKDEVQYEALGLIDVHAEMHKYDYVCLFSEKEGLPLSLIEGCMYGKPLLTNMIPSALEINSVGFNGYAADTWDDIINMINIAPEPSSKEYAELSDNARKRFSQDFSYDKMIESYKNYLKSIG